MASIISAGTTSATALNMSADTSGVLQLASNNGTVAVTVDTSQRVGIGTSSPSSKLYIAGTDPYVYIGDANSPGSSDKLVGFGYSTTSDYGDIFAFQNGAGPKNLVIQRLGGNVGIGTTSPDGLLDVDAGGSNAAVYIQSTNASRLFIKGGSYNWNIASNYYVAGALTFTNAGGTVTTTMLDNGNVGINATPSAGNMLYVQGGSDIAITGLGSGTSSRSFQGGQASASYAWHVAALQTTRTANSAFSFLICESDASSTFDKEFILRGDGNGYADGTWNNNGADYAEYFESSTGEALPVGSTVVLDGEKIRLALPSDSADDVIGVVRPKEPSKASMVIGNTAWNKWANKYLTDEFDRYIMEDHDVVEWTDEDEKFHSYESQSIPKDVVVPESAVRKSHDENGIKYQHYKLNPEWNPDVEYVNRENRPEWNIIGLVGQVKVLKNQPVNARWIKMRDVGASVEEWFIR